LFYGGGVQSDNENAINFYTKAGFKMLGSFEHFGTNYDMMLTIEA
jgi:ribosomal protein S18 acetylase RimI-like enzyme